MTCSNRGRTMIFPNSLRTVNFARSDKIARNRRQLRLVTGFLILAVCPTAGNLADQGFVGAIQQAKRYVVPIACFGQNPDTKEPYLISIEGTGFFVSADGDVVTAGHVGRNLFSTPRIPSCPFPGIYVPVKGWDIWTASVDIRIIPIAKCFQSGDADVAICKTAANPFTLDSIKTKPRTAELETVIPEDGTPIAFTGFPLNFVQPITSQGIVGTYRSANEKVGPQELVVDKNAWPGASGSPVYTANGKVIGMIVQRGSNEASGLAFAIPSRILVRILGEYRAAERKKDNK